MNLPSVAIVILNWNGKKFLEQFLPSVIASTYANKRVIVADNASSDDSVGFLQKNFPAIEIIQNEKNEGFAKGYNSVLKKIKSDYYVLLNSDVEVTPGWIEPVIALLQSDKKIAACQPKILLYNDRSYFEYAGAAGGWIDNFGYPFSRGRIFDELEKDKGQYDNAAPCFWASGAALFVKAAAYHAMSGLDEFFFAHQEEIDFCWRLQLAGYKIFVEPKSIVYHVGGGTLVKGHQLKVYLNFRNNLIMLAKNLSFTNALWKIPFRLWLDAIAAWKELFAGNTGYFFSVIKAHVNFIAWLLFYKHKSIFPVDKSGKINGRYPGSIVWQHFIKKKNRFSEIVDKTQ